MTDKKTLATRYLAALNDELGWNAAIDEESEVSFPSESGLRVWLSNSAPSDPEYLRMFMGVRLSQLLKQIGSSLDVQRIDHQALLIAAAAISTRRTKGTKVVAVPADDQVVFSVEIVAAGPDRMPSIELLSGILPRMRSMLMWALRNLGEGFVLADLEIESAADRTDISGRFEL